MAKRDKVYGADRAGGPDGRAQQWTKCVVEQVIHVRFSRGTGTADDPHREVDAWFTFEGMLIAEDDIHARSNA